MPVWDRPLRVEDTPTVADPLAAAVSGALGGPMGRRALLGESRWWTPIRVLVLLVTFTMTLGTFQKSSCATHAYSHEYQYTRLCYTDVLALWYGEHLDEGKVPILDNETPGQKATYVEYPVVIGAFMGLAEGLTHRLVPAGPSAHQQAAIDQFARDQAVGLKSTDPRFGVDQFSAANATAAADARQGRYFFDITALLLLLAAIATVVCTGLTAGRRRIWDAALVGLAPALLLNGLVNWDLVAVAFTAGAMLAWARQRPALAGALLGLGIATKLYPLLLLLPLAALCLRVGRLRTWSVCAGWAAIAWLVVDVPVWVANPAGFGRFYSFSETRGTEYNSLFYAWQYFVYGADSSWDPVRAAAGRSPTWLNFWSAVVLIGGLVTVVLVCLLAPRRPRLAQAAFLTVLVFVLSNKVFSPQYTLWLLPLAVLARPRWRYFLIWQASEVLLMITLYAHLVNVDTSGGKGIGYAWFFWVGLVPRDLLLLGFGRLVLREIWHPDTDVVRRDGADDPGGGVLDGAADVFPAPPPPDDDPLGADADDALALRT